MKKGEIRITKLQLPEWHNCATILLNNFYKHFKYNHENYQTTSSTKVPKTRNNLIQPHLTNMFLFYKFQVQHFFTKIFFLKQLSESSHVRFYNKNKKITILFDFMRFFDYFNRIFDECCYFIPFPLLFRYKFRL